MLTGWCKQHLEELEKYIADTDAKQGKGKGGVLSVNQIELNPWLPHRDIVDWCQKRGVLLQAWAPLAQGDRWGDKILQEVVKRTGKSEAQILIRWSLQKVCSISEYLSIGSEAKSLGRDSNRCRNQSHLNASWPMQRYSTSS